MDEEIKKRLKTYYELLERKDSGFINVGIIDMVISALSDEDAVALELKLEKNDPLYRRLTAYAVKISSVMAAEQQITDGIDPDGKNTGAIREISNAFNNYDKDQDTSEEINGNRFIFKKTFPIEEFRAVLEEYGNEETGNQWYVQLDADGRLVVY